MIASGSGAAARWRASSSGVMTRSRRRSPESTLILGVAAMTGLASMSA